MAEKTTPARHPRRRGDSTRRRILTILLDRQEAGESFPTMEELAQALSSSLSNTRYHVDWLQEQGLIAVRATPRQLVRYEIVLLPHAKPVLPTENAT